jgi:putative glutamine amidotransferase
LIGITTSEVRVPDGERRNPEGDPPRTEMVLGMKYCLAVEGAGGLPVVVPPMEDDAVDPLLDRLSGVCLSGGPDIDPGTYGGRYHEKLGPTEPDLDRFELALLRGALERGMPVLAICRGAQMLNVALGGNLYQHLPEDPGGAVDHRKRKADDPDTVHDVRVEPGTVLARALGQQGETHVNSFHHQAAHSLGRDLCPVAWAPDGVVEAIELPDRDFVVGVQWHAEALVDREEQAALFKAFVAAASRYDAPPAQAIRAA